VVISPVWYHAKNLAKILGQSSIFSVTALLSSIQRTIALVQATNLFSGGTVNSHPSESHEPHMDLMYPNSRSFIPIMGPVF